MVAIATGMTLVSCGDLATRPPQSLPAVTNAAANEPLPPADLAADTAAATPRTDAVVRSEPHTPPQYFTTLVEKARALHTQPASASKKVELPAVLRNMNYQAYRSIRFRPDQSLWRGEPGQFEAQFFHLGFYYQEPVSMHVVSMDGKSEALFPFSPKLFSYDGVKAPPADANLGFAGVRLHAPLNTQAHRDEVIVFQGASYFRSLARGQVYGMSARGLAIDTGEPTPEEFPRFSELYLVRPGPSDHFAWVLALLESPRATGAYAFRIEPGDDTIIEVTARIFPRGKVSTLGLAPLTSMYLFGEEQPARFGDFRPEVHDSDGMMMHGQSGEWLYRPLRNPDRTTTSTFRLDSPRGFGLVQRDRDFSSYQDLEAHYHERPSIWIEPIGDWGKGAVRLLEIGTQLETDDNIAALWAPDEVPQGVPNDGLSIRYRMHVGSNVPQLGPPGRVVATRVARTEKGARFLVDFATERDGASAEGVHVVVNATGGKIVEHHVEANPHTKTLRASFEVARTGGAAQRDIELRAFLREDTDVLTETWSYLWQPKP